MTTTLSERAYDFLRARLADGSLAPGQRLVNRSLAEEIGVSVIPVREAIHRLASEGLVDHVPGSGAFVRRPDVAELDNLYVLRDALESCAAGEAARHISEFQLEELEAIIEAAEELSRRLGSQRRNHATQKQLDAWLDTESRFHALLIQSARNPLLARVIADHRAISQVFDAQRNSPQFLTAEVAHQTCHGKRELLNALKAGDTSLARELTSQQIQRGRRTLIRLWSSKESPGTSDPTSH